MTVHLPSTAAVEPTILVSASHVTKQFTVKLSPFSDRVGTVHALDDVSLDIMTGETLALVGESGSGKSTLGQAILQLMSVTHGDITYKGMQLATMPPKQLRALRRHLQLVAQDPLSSLNPRMTVAQSIEEPLRLHNPRLSAGEIAARAADLLRQVGLGEMFLTRYPHEISGGQCQRVAIGRALACDPDFIVCDEILSSLDVSVQAQVGNLLVDLQKERNLTYLFIAHDLSMVRHLADRVAVMYLGTLVELAPCQELFARPLHPYTLGLIAAAPGSSLAETQPPLKGEIPSPLDPPSGCRFHTRCPHAVPLCAEERPLLRELAPGHQVACHLAETILHQTN